jgi:N-acyl-D-amino-acid deacylase
MVQALSAIAAIGQDLAVGGAIVIDSTGQVIAPGFIDTHSHSDLKVLLDPKVEPKIRQGITTEILGQDGVAMAPLPLAYIQPWRKNLAGLDGDTDQIDWTFQTTANYLKMIADVKPYANECYLAPHGNIRMAAMGLDNRQPNDAELAEMSQIMRREMEAGAFGLSTGLIYMPCAYSRTDEIIELCKVVASLDGVFVIHQRSEADTILESMAEVIRIGRESGVRIHYSHFKVCGRKNWDKLDRVFDLLEKAQAEGIRVSFDAYPYVAGSTMLGVILPPWVHDGGTDMAMERLADPQLRIKMIADIENSIPGWDNFIEFAGLDQIFVTSVTRPGNAECVGKSLAEIGVMRGQDAYNAAFDLLLDEQNAVGMVDFYGTEDHIKRMLNRPEMNACTDGLMAGKPHPRVFGAFPRILGKYVREEQAVSLEAAVRKLSGKPADAFSIKNRGYLKPGYFADITVFDPATIIDKGTFTDPIHDPEGITCVFVNGGLALHNGRMEQTVGTGRVLRFEPGINNPATQQITTKGTQ